MRDTTVAGLIAKLQEIVQVNPEAAGYAVTMEASHDGFDGLWRGTVFQFPEDQALQLETSA